jgi:hypothetical protein
MMTLETLLLFEHLLNQVQVPASAADFAEISQRIIQAKTDLAAALAEVAPPVD